MIYMCQRISQDLRVSDHFSNFSSFIINSATLSWCLNSIDLANSCQRNHSLLLDKQTRQKFVLSACTCALSQLDFWDKSANPSNPVFLYFEANRHSIILFLQYINKSGEDGQTLGNDGNYSRGLLTVLWRGADSVPINTLTVQLE